MRAEASSRKLKAPVNSSESVRPTSRGPVLVDVAAGGVAWFPISGRVIGRVSIVFRIPVRFFHKGQFRCLVDAVR